MKISDEIRAEVSEMGMHPFDINDGYCEDFANNVIARMGGYRDGLCETEVEIETKGQIGCQDLPGHVWIVCDGLHYDAEEPQGVDDWRELPLFARLGRIDRYKELLGGLLR